MQIDEPTWSLRDACPVCGQGACLVLIACPECGHLAAACAEEGTFFPDPDQVTNVSMTEGKIKNKKEKCPKCEKGEISNFKPATSEQIQKAGLKKDQYL
jgi:ribosomal protein S27AE